MIYLVPVNVKYNLDIKFASFIFCKIIYHHNVSSLHIFPCCYVRFYDPYCHNDLHQIHPALTLQPYDLYCHSALNHQIRLVCFYE